MTDDLLALEKKLERSLVLYEQLEKYELALQHYKEVESEIIQWMDQNNVNTMESNKLLAQCYLRQAGMFRQLGRREEATVANEKEIESARLSGSSIAYAQSLFSTGINLLSNREVEEGLKLLAEAKVHFEAEDTIEHQQGVGWYWVILADLGNKGIIPCRNEDIINYASKAITILTEIQNAPGVARAYEARAVVYKKTGKHLLAEEDLIIAKNNRLLS